MTSASTDSAPAASPGQPLLTATFEELLERARLMVSDGQPGSHGTRRRLLGITGAPGAGKSTLCAALVEALGEDAVLVGMDGFHLANAELVRLGRRQRKGAPDTFDVDGFTHLLARLRGQQSGTVYAPTFNRALEESIGSAVPVRGDVPLVVTEGNYLLLDDHGWDGVRAQLDEVWYLEVPAEVRVRRLVGRRASFGETADQAAAWVHGVDQANAGHVEPSRARADLLIHLTTRLTATRTTSGATTERTRADEAAAENTAADLLSAGVEADEDSSATPPRPPSPADRDVLIASQSSDEPGTGLAASPTEPKELHR